ncbi:MAG: ComF family protein [Deltaproteobacteria bacterium]|jgi:ComF family protein|nr:ComF family protein [Deltaproteobacteria bacterium]
MSLPGNFLGGLAAFAAERRCAACASVFMPSSRTDPPSAFYCPSCAKRLQRRQQGCCPLCGAPAPWPQAPSALCSSCLEKAPPWKQAFFHAPYEDLLRELILRFKFQGQLALALPLGSLLASHPDLAACPAQVIIPIPLPAKRLAQRGFNQALELARPLARRLGKPLDAGLLLRVRQTEPQPGLSRAERFRNLAQAFSAPRPLELQGRHVLLLDDIMTSGATLRAAGATLRAARAASVAVAALARTPEQLSAPAGQQLQGIAD